MLKVKSMITDRWGRGIFIVIACFGAFACSETGQQSVSCDTTAVPKGADASALDHQVDYKAFNSTFLQPEVAKLYGIDQDETLGVVMVSVYQKDALGVGVEACVSGGVMNLIGQVNRLDFDEIREGKAIYHIGTFWFGQKEKLTFNLDVEIPSTGKKHELKWQQQFWRG